MKNNRKRKFLSTENHEPPKSITTMVCYHDLLGYGDMVSVSGGNLDSIVGQIAHHRIDTLRHTISAIKKQFPTGSSFFQINDSIIVTCDIDYQIKSMHIDSRSISSSLPSAAASIEALKFVCGAASLHQETINNDNEKEIGPGGRTFIVLGKRWPISQLNDGVQDIPELQANLAYAEAYIADSLGSKFGFLGQAWENIYINDNMQFLLSIASASIPDEIEKLCKLHPTINHFPRNIMNQELDPIDVLIFHRKRRFYSLLSHYAKDISEALSSKKT